MKKFQVLAVLAILWLAVAACGDVKKSHQMDVKETETDLMKYNSVAQGVNKDGQVGVQLSLIGQSKHPVQTIETRQVPVTVTAHSAQPHRPVYRRDTRAAKAVPRTPPASPPVAKTEMKTVVTTTTTYRGPEVLATIGGGGPSTGHSVAAGLAMSVPAAAGFVGGNAVAPGMNIAVGGAKAIQQQGQMQGQATNNRNININPNTNVNNVNAVSGSSSSSASSAGAAAASN